MIMAQGMKGGLGQRMEYLSFSRLSLLETCGLRFYYEYVEKATPTDEVVTYHASFGKVIHSLYEEHGNSHGRVDYDVLKIRYDETFVPIVEEFPTREDAVAFYKKGLQAISRFSQYQVDDVIDSEKEFLIDIAKDIPPMKGFIDRVLHVPTYGYVVADLKTGKPFSQQDLKKTRQIVLYSLACQDLYGEPAKEGYFDFVVQGGRVWLRLDEQDRLALKAWVVDKWKQILREEFQPKYTKNFCRSFCPFRSRCPEYERRQTV
jgi:CRISPR/Cas system-associated exonuclease Cas4 (RecB family)